MAAPSPANAKEASASSTDLQAITFTTPRLFYRREQLSDAEDVFLTRGNPNGVRYVIYPADLTFTTTRESMQKRMSHRPNFTFAITLLHPSPDPQPTPTVIGLVGGTTLPEIGYMLNEAHWGQGYASEALAGFMAMYWARFPQGYPGIAGEERYRHRLKATTNPANEASRRVLAKGRVCGGGDDEGEGLDGGEGDRAGGLGCWAAGRGERGRGGSR